MFDFNQATRIEIPVPGDLYVALMTDSKGKRILIVINPTGREYANLRYNINFYNGYPKAGILRELIRKTERLNFKDGYIQVGIGAREAKFFEIGGLENSPQ